MTTGHMVGKFFTPIEYLCVVDVHDNKPIQKFIEETRILTLEELLARVRINSGRNQIFCNFGSARDPEYRLMRGYGKAFIKLINQILEDRFRMKGCYLSEIQPHDVPLS